MTPEQFTANLPPLTADPLPIRPPFEFNGLSARVFPLRANMDAVQQVVNSYINIVPPEVGRFRATVPYVYLAILDYGQITEQASSLGWFAQAEIFFCVPVEWYRVVNGKWVFQDWAVLTPFIYVDDRISVPMGRSVYGFPKALAHINRTLNPWTKDVLAPETICSIETDVMPELYDGQRLEPKTFLEVKRQLSPMSAQSLPPKFNNPMTPLSIISNAARSMDEFTRDAIWMAQSFRIFENSPGPVQWLEMLQKLMPAFRITGPGMLLNSLNLKQFRSSENPENICYQALTSGRMQTTAVSGGGLLGAERIALGDLSGGHTIELSEYPSLPIIQKLGLDVNRKWRGDGVNVAELTPVMPFWMKVNELYRHGQNLTWRCEDGIWRHANGDPVKQATPPVPNKEPPRFNTTVNSVLDDIAGPFKFTGVNLRLLFLKASIAKMQEFLDTYVNNALKDPTYKGRNKEDGRFRLRAYADGNEDCPDEGHVLLTVATIGGVKSKSNNVGDWAKYDLSFMVPVRWEYGGLDDEWEILGFGMLPAYNFVDDSSAAISRREVQGIPTLNGIFVKPQVGWLEGNLADFSKPQSLLQIQTELIPAIGVGQQSQTFTIIDITSTNHPRSKDGNNIWLGTHGLDEDNPDNSDHADIPSQADQQAVEVVQKMDWSMLSSYLLDNYTIKQFRDVTDPLKACFQSVQRLSRYFEMTEQPELINADIEVTLRDFPTLQIKESLGIEGTLVEDGGAGLEYKVKVETPVNLYCTIDEELGEPLLTRVGTRAWSASPDAFRPTATSEPDADSESTGQTADMTLRQEGAFGNALPNYDELPAEAESAAPAPSMKDAFVTLGPQKIIAALCKPANQSTVAKKR